MATQVVELLGGERVLGQTVKTNLDLARATRGGLPPESAIQLASSILDSAELRSAAAEAIAAVLKEISDREAAISEAVSQFDPSAISEAIRQAQSWQTAFDLVIGPMGPVTAEALRALAEAAASHTLARRLTAEESDLIFRTASVMSRAIEVLGNKNKAVHWLTNPNRALGGEFPINLLDTSAGTHELETILDRIEYGVYS